LRSPIRSAAEVFVCTEASPAPPPDAPALLEDDEATGGFSFFKLSLSAVVSVIRVGGRRSIAVWVRNK
jgi:hypothetical protein